MKMLFVYPGFGKKKGQKYIFQLRTFEPLTFAYLRALTPYDIECELIDERIEAIDYDNDADVVIITLETYTARHGYEIAKRFREKGKKVIVGGTHASLVPDEAMKYADSVVTGYADDIWGKIIEDYRNRTEKKLYVGGLSNKFLIPDRSIFKKKYLISVVETGRGCPHHCEFCAISAVNKKRYAKRPVDSVIEELKHIKSKYIFFADDNFVADPKYALELCDKIKPLKKKWISQGAITMAKNEKLLAAMRDSGCLFILIGYESINKEALDNMKKEWSYKLGDIEESTRIIHKYNIGIYATFVFGFEEKIGTTFEDTVKFAQKNHLEFVQFNYLVPFPNTELYFKMEKEGRLLYKKWWLEPQKYSYLFFEPYDISTNEFRDRCIAVRYAYHSVKNILGRTFDVLKRTKNIPFSIMYLFLSFGQKAVIKKFQDLPIGDNLDEKIR